MQKIYNYLTSMRDKIAAKKKENKAFTLIELIIVIVIIGVLVAMAMADYSRNTEDSKIARAKADVRNLAGAATLYYQDTGEIPTVCDGTLNKTETIDGQTKGPWMKICPVSPWPGTSDYEIQENSSATEYVDFNVSIKTDKGDEINSANLSGKAGSQTNN